MNAFDQYHELAARLVGKDEFPLPLPNWSRDYPHNIGLLSDAEDSALAAAVMQFTRGMNFESWRQLDLEQRLPWMRVAVDNLEQREEDRRLTATEVYAALNERAQTRTRIVAADELATWPEGLLDQLVADGVLKATSNAAAVACDACGNDHVEKVEYIQSPPGTELRAYISCPQNGRVRVLLDRLRQWIINKRKTLDAGRVATGNRESKKRRGEQPPAKRSWTQADLNEAIREHKAKRASTYSDLISGVKRGKAGAKKSARQLFGRNSIARALGVKSKAMVTNSPAWQEIADELGLRGRSSKTIPAMEQRIGMDIALEEQSVACSETVVDLAIRRETVALIVRTMPSEAAQATIEKLDRGEISDDKAREVVRLYRDQLSDEKMSRVRQAP
jgi:hypothetical protein